MTFCAKLRVKGSEKEQADTVNEIIKDLNIENCVDNSIGSFVQKGISGGEKKKNFIGY